MLDILAQQVAAPVQFIKGLRTLYQAGARMFVEVGPKKALQGFAEDVLGDEWRRHRAFHQSPEGWRYRLRSTRRCAAFTRQDWAAPLRKLLPASTAVSVPAVSRGWKQRNRVRRRQRTALPPPAAAG